MIKHNQNGAGSLGLMFVVTLILLVVALFFGIWAFGSRQSYKNSVDAKVNTAVQTAIKTEDSKDAAAYAEQAKYPLATYNGPQAYGSLVIQYPKSWSGYVDSTGQGGALLNGYFNPGVVPAINNQNSIFALRVEVLNQTYSQTLQSFNGDQNGGQSTVSAYSLPALPNVVGVEVSGQIGNNQSGTMVVLPLRANTLEIYTEGSQYLSDFNNNILKNFSFSP